MPTKKLCGLIILLSLFQTSFAQNVNLLIEKARSQIGVTLGYDPNYRKLDYPNGDVSRSTGVCSDVIIRSFRDAFNVDLQSKVHEDMKKNFHLYPKLWGLKTTDRNIDHRRVPNLEVFFKRFAKVLPISQNADDYQAGDIVTQRLNNTLPHILIVSDKKNKEGTRPLMIHNIGGGAQEEDVLFDHKIVGHFRFLPK